MNNTLATFSNVLRKMYRPEATQATIYENNPTYARIKKIGDFEGQTIENAVAVSYGQGVGSTLAFAIANKTGDAFQRFSVPRKLVYGVGTIDGELIRAAKTGKGSQVAPALQRVRDNNLKVVRRYLNHSLWNNGGGAFGRIASFPTTSSVQLTEPNDIVWFEQGQIIQLSSDDGSPSAPAGVRTGTITVTQVDRDNGIIVFSTVITASIAAAVTGDYLFRNGSYAAVFDGIPRWIPRTKAEAVQALYGVSRATDTTRLAGLRLETAAGATVLETMYMALARAGREGIEPDMCPMNPDDLQALMMSQQDKVMYSGSSNGKLSIGFKGNGIQVMSPASGAVIEVFADPGVRRGDGWLLSSKTWEYHYAGKNFPELLDDDGISMLREATADAYTWRVGGYGNLICTSPQDNMYFAMPQG